MVLTDIGKIAIYEKSEDVPFVTINSQKRWAHPKHSAKSDSERLGFRAVIFSQLSQVHLKLEALREEEYDKLRGQTAIENTIIQEWTWRRAWKSLKTKTIVSINVADGSGVAVYIPSHMLDHN